MKSIFPYDCEACSMQACIRKNEINIGRRIGVDIDKEERMIRLV